MKKYSTFCISIGHELRTHSERFKETSMANEEISRSDKLTGDKVLVEELRLPEIMIPSVTKTKGGNKLHIFFHYMYNNIIIIIAIIAIIITIDFTNC